MNRFNPAMSYITTEDGVVFQKACHLLGNTPCEDSECACEEKMAHTYSAYQGVESLPDLIQQDPETPISEIKELN